MSMDLTSLRRLLWLSCSFRRSTQQCVMQTLVLQVPRSNLPKVGMERLHWQKTTGRRLSFQNFHRGAASKTDPDPWIRSNRDANFEDIPKQSVKEDGHKHFETLARTICHRCESCRRRYCCSYSCQRIWKRCSFSFCFCHSSCCWMTWMNCGQRICHSRKDCFQKQRPK